MRSKISKQNGARWGKGWHYQCYISCVSSFSVTLTADDFWRADKGPGFMNKRLAQTCIDNENILKKYNHGWLKNSCLPPEMKSVQWAARTARTSGSGAQASRSEAAS